jgi:hypothetical protein
MSDLNGMQTGEGVALGWTLLHFCEVGQFLGVAAH